MHLSSGLYPKLKYRTWLWFWPLTVSDSYWQLPLFCSTRLTFCKDRIILNISCWILNQYSCIDYSSKINWNTEKEAEHEQLLALHFHHLGRAEQGGRFYCKDRKFYTNNFISTYWIKYMKLVGMKFKTETLQISLACMGLMTCLICTLWGSGVNDLSLIWQLVWFRKKG